MATVRFGVCADIHKDIMHDADARLQTFIDVMEQLDVDFILSLGDFCQPQEANRPFLAIWESYAGPRYHVLGNHDTDGGFTRQQVLQYTGMPARYYCFDIGGYHFVILDGNDEREGRAPGYPHFIAADQLDWLRVDLASTSLQTILFSHQSLEDMVAPEQGVENGAQVRQVLEEANRHASEPKVIACFSGHNHVDGCRQIGGIHYVQINSMSNYWLGDDYKEIRYGEEVDREHPWIKYTAPYQDPLFAVITVGDQSLRIEGNETRFVGSSPWDLAYPHPEMKERIVPMIRNRDLRLG